MHDCDLALRRWRQENQEFKVIFSYIVCSISSHVVWPHSVSKIRTKQHKTPTNPPKQPKQKLYLKKNHNATPLMDFKCFIEVVCWKLGEVVDRLGSRT